MSGDDRDFKGQRVVRDGNKIATSANSLASTRKKRAR